MEIAVNRAFSLLRTRQASEQVHTEAVIVVSPRAMYNALASAHAAETPPDWIDMTPYARALANRNVTVVTPGKLLDATANAQYYIVTGDATMMDAAAKETLRRRLKQGRDIIAVDASLAREWKIPVEPWANGLYDFPNGAGTFYQIEIEE